MRFLDRYCTGSGSIYDLLKPSLKVGQGVISELVQQVAVVSDLAAVAVLDDGQCCGQAGLKGWLAVDASGGQCVRQAAVHFGAVAMSDVRLSNTTRRDMCIRAWRGFFTGEIDWTLEEDGPEATRMILHERTETEWLLINLTAHLGGRWLFERNHAAAMRRGEEGMRAALARGYLPPDIDGVSRDSVK